MTKNDEKKKKTVMKDGHVDLKQSLYFNDELLKTLKTFTEVKNIITPSLLETMNVHQNISHSIVADYPGVTGVVNDLVNQVVGENFNVFREFAESSVVQISRQYGTIREIRNNYSELLSGSNFSDIEITNEDINYAIEIIEEDKLDTFIERELPPKNKKNFSEREKSRFATLQFIIDILTLVLTVICPPIEVDVTNVQENYNVHIENATFISEADGVKWLENELTKERLEKNYRIVMKTNLVVRTEKRKKSHIVGVLQPGYVVQMIKKERNWSYILYSSPDHSEIISGWTNTRYLRSINHN